MKVTRSIEGLAKWGLKLLSLNSNLAWRQDDPTVEGPSSCSLSDARESNKGPSLSFQHNQTHTAKRSDSAFRY